MRVFKDVDIISALRKIVNNNNLHYKSDYEYDAETLGKAAEDSRFLWMSRTSGTWLFDERDVHIRNTYAYNTWQYYTDTEYYGVKAFAVCVNNNEYGKPIGDIYELNYNNHLEAVARSSFNAETVDITFKPTHIAPAHTHSFDVAEYNDNFRSIINRYGEAESVRHNLSTEDEALLTEILDNFKTQYEEESVPAVISDYIREMVTERFHEYGYTQDDMVFTAPDDAATALKYRIPVHVLYPDNTAERIKHRKNIAEAAYEGRMFGMNSRDKRLLNFYKAGNKLTDLPFTRDELRTIFQMALNRGKRGITDEQQRKAIDNIIHVLDIVIFSYDCINEADFFLDQELDDGIEQ
jgi:hypothetical protein